MGSIIEISIISIISLFTLLSCFAQFKKPFGKVVNQIDKYGILPNWSFFAPIPGTSDYRIVFCDIDILGHKSNWQEVEMGFKKKRTVDFFWNPKKYFQKGIIDLIQALLLEYADCKEKRLIQFSWSYLVLLQIVIREKREQDIRSRQFAIVSTKGFDSNKDLDLVFISFKHKLSNGDPI